MAGIINSVGFLAFGAFVSHVSGHATRAAVEYTEGHWRMGSAFFFATLYFISGAVFTTLLTSAQSIETRTKRFTIPLVVELFLILYVMFRALRLATPMSGITSSQSTWFIFILSFLMGLQNALIRNASGTIVRTTHMTGVATDIGIALGTACLSFLQETVKQSKKSFAVILADQHGFQAKISAAKKLFRTTIHSFVNMFRYERLLLHVSVLVSFLAGAVIGTLGFVNFFFYTLLLPAALLFAIIVKELFFTRRKQPAQEPHNVT